MIDEPKTLTGDQEEAVEMIVAWLEGADQEFRLGGYAGTGKTTLIKHIMARLKIATGVGAFTGKAVSVLRKKGVGRAVTLHSMLYDTKFDDKTKKMIWVPKFFLPYDFVIVDEASMVSDVLYAELKRHKIKILFVGDPGQLEPVGGNPNLMRTCNYVLQNIHRQAQGNPILQAANDVRLGKIEILELGEIVGEDGNGKLTVLDSLYGLDLLSYDIIICAKNATRHGMNEKQRVLLERFSAPIVGEKTICLKNDKQIGVFNGMMLTIEKINDSFKHGFYTDVIDDAGDRFEDVPIRSEYFGKNYRAQDFTKGEGIPFDFGYALTCHKSQGSAWDKVLVIDEPLWETDWNRWAYTAFTRAAKELTVVNTY